MSRLTWQTLMSVTLVAMLQLSLTIGTDNNNNKHDDDNSVMAGCSEAVCARVVTKCLLTERCKCNFAIGNYTCHKECFSCLAELCYDCCSCFGMCPKATSSPLNRVSSIEELDEPIPQLFEIYTDEGGDDQVPPRYTTVTLLQEKTLKEPGGQQHLMKRNCTVAYVTKCTSIDECRTVCIDMGASFSRWFHDGCCECVGDKCFDYGINESRCNSCPPTFGHDYNVDKNDFYYGEDDDDGFFYETEDDHNSWTTNLTHLDEELKDK